MNTVNDLASVAVKQILTMGFVVIVIVAVIKLGFTSLENWLRNVTKGQKSHWDKPLSNESDWMARKETKREPRREAVGRYRDRFRLLDTWETDLYSRLIEALPNLIVFSQVSLPQVLYIQGQNAQQQLNEVGRMSVDFLMCKKNGGDITTIAAIELNGGSHDKEERQRADAIKQRALTEAGIPLIVYDVGNMPNVETIRRNMASAITARKQYETERDKRFNKGKQ